MASDRRGRLLVNPRSAITCITNTGNPSDSPRNINHFQAYLLGMSGGQMGFANSGLLPRTDLRVAGLPTLTFFPFTEYC